MQSHGKEKTSTKQRDHFSWSLWCFTRLIRISGLMILLVAMSGLPTAQFPNIVPPEIKISATYTGADALVSLYKAMGGGWINVADRLPRSD